MFFTRTYRYRLKDTACGKYLDAHAEMANVVWNFTKNTQIVAAQRASGKRVFSKKEQKEIVVGPWLDRNQLHALTKGSSKLLNLHSQTIQAIYEDYEIRRQQFKKLLRWRGKKSLGWIPFKASRIEIFGDRVRYQKKTYRFWNSRPLPPDAKITNGSFAQDSRRRWDLNITFQTKKLDLTAGQEDVGVDLGIKYLAALSNETKVARPALRETYLKDIRKLERTRKYARRQQARTKKYSKLPKAKRAAALAAKVSNRRKDYLHKESRKIVLSARVLIVGDLKCKFMNRNKSLSGISLDNGIGKFKELLRYKAIGAGVAFDLISERNSTQTCSSCGWRHPPERRIGLGVREWLCPSCGAMHDRDINAARNLLRMGHHTLIPVAS